MPPIVVVVIAVAPDTLRSLPDSPTPTLIDEVTTGAIGEVGSVKSII